MAKYLKEEYSAPVMEVIGMDNDENARFQRVEEWADCAISINTDVEHLYEQS